MSQVNARISTPRTNTTPPPMDRWDLLRDGLTVDHFYRRFIEINRDGCPRCGHHHLGMARRSYGQNTGWEWCCMNCAQRWREPKITVGLIHRDSNSLKKPEKTDILITEYKY
jgi:hypothetical protein